MWVCRLPVHIGPLGSFEFAVDFRETVRSAGGQSRPPLQGQGSKRLFVGADVSVGPKYNEFAENYRKTLCSAGPIRRPQASFEAQPRFARLLAPKMRIDP